MSEIKNKTYNQQAGPGPLPSGPVYDGIATKLRELYLDLENEGVPDELLNLLERLDEAERAQTARNDSGVNVDG